MREKEQKKKFYMSLFIIIIMILSVFGFATSFFQPQDQNTAADYNGFEFTQNRETQQWQTTVDGRSYTFYSHPRNLNQYIPSEIHAAIQSSPVVALTFNPNITRLQYVDAARFELRKILKDKGKVVRQGTTINTTSYDLPVITCDSKGTVIRFNPSNTSSIHKQDNCITINASQPGGYLRYAEHLGYKLLGVKNGKES